MRRAPGEGSLFHDEKRDLWVATVSYWDDDGKRKQRRAYAKAYRDAVDKLEKLKADMADGISLSGMATMSEWVDAWLRDIHKNQVRPTTLRDYKGTAVHIRKHLGKKRLDKITAQDVRKMLTSLGIGQRRTEKAYVLTHRLLEDARKERLIRWNPAESVHKPDVKTTPRGSFTIEEAQKLLGVSATRSPMEHARWVTAFLTGERQAEVLGLEWDRVDFERNVIDVSWQLQTLSKAHGCGEPDKDGAYPCGKVRVGFCPDAYWDVPPKFEMRECHKSTVWTRPKSQAGQRWVPMIAPLREALLALREHDASPNPHNLVFHNADGRPISSGEDTDAWDKLIEDAGVRKLKHHSVRHTTATILRAAGVDEATRMELLGHATAEVTRIYAHADAARNAAVMDALGALLPAPKELPE